MIGRVLLFLFVFSINFVNSEENVTDNVVLKVNNEESTLSPSLVRPARNALPIPEPDYNGNPDYQRSHSTTEENSAGTITFIVILVVGFIAIVACIGGCIYCCIYGCCCTPKEHQQQTYTSQTWIPPPPGPMSMVMVPVGPPVQMQQQQPGQLMGPDAGNPQQPQYAPQAPVQQQEQLQIQQQQTQPQIYVQQGPVQA